MGCASDQSSDSVSPNDASKSRMFDMRKMNYPLWVRNASIYQVDLRRYTAEGTFNAFREHIPRLKALGVNVINFLPVYPVGLDRRETPDGHPYAIADFTKIDPELGSFEDFKSLVIELKRNQIYVILDWVANQTAWDHPWVQSHPEWYLKKADTITHVVDGNGNSTDVHYAAALDFTVEPLRNTIIESMKYWLRAAEIDGFRCVQSDFVPDDFWADVRTGLESIKPVYMLTATSGHIPHLEQCFQTDYAWSLYQLLKDMSAGEANVGDLIQYIENDRSTHPVGYTHANFLTNAQLQASGENPATIFGPSYKAFTALTFLLDGIPLIYNGQEAQIMGAFEDNTPLTWEIDEEINRLYLGLLQLKDYNRALWNGKYGGPLEVIADSETVFAMERELDGQTVVLIVNCTPQPAQITFKKSVRIVSDLFTGQDLNINEGSALSLQPWEFRIAANPSILIE